MLYDDLERVMGMTSTAGYDIWSEDVPKTTNYSTSTNEGRHFKPQPNYSTSKNGGRHYKSKTNYPTSRNGGRHFEPQSNKSNNQAPIYGGRHFEPQLNKPTPTNGGRHFKPQVTDPNDPTKIAHITRGGRHFSKHPLKKMRSSSNYKKTKANISLWGLLMASYKHH